VRKSFIAAATSGDYSEEVAGLVEKLDDPELRESVSALLPA
jgi:hypothetical protein